MDLSSSSLSRPSLFHLQYCGCYVECVMFCCGGWGQSHNQQQQLMNINRLVGYVLLKLPATPSSSHLQYTPYYNIIVCFIFFFIENINGRSNEKKKSSRIVGASAVNGSSISLLCMSIFISFPSTIDFLYVQESTRRRGSTFWFSHSIHRQAGPN